jgi:hypothetical protein
LPFASGPIDQNAIGDSRKDVHALRALKTLGKIPLNDRAPAVGPYLHVDHFIDQTPILDGSRYDLTERGFMPEKKADGPQARECPGFPQKDAEVVSSGQRGGIVEQTKKRFGRQPVFRVAK